MSDVPLIEVVYDPRPVATLPNCDGCGQFTSKPTVERWCEGQGDFHNCYEVLLCLRCAKKVSDND